MALQQQEKNFARTRVIVEDQEPKRVLGYYALLPAQVDTTHFPPGRKFPRRLPCLLLGRLAVDRIVQGRRIGELLLVDAIERTRRSIAEIGGAGLYADALNERAAAFYVRYGFRPLLDDPKRLFTEVRFVLRKRQVVLEKVHGRGAMKRPSRGEAIVTRLRHVARRATRSTMTTDELMALTRGD